MLLPGQLLRGLEQALGRLTQTVAGTVIHICHTACAYGRLATHPIALSRRLVLSLVSGAREKLRAVSADHVDRVPHAMHSILDTRRHLGVVADHVDGILTFTALVQQLLSLLKAHLVVLAGHLDLSEAGCAWTRLPGHSTSEHGSRVLRHVQIVDAMLLRFVVLAQRRISNTITRLEPALAGSTEALGWFRHYIADLLYLSLRRQRTRVHIIVVSNLHFSIILGMS